MPSEQTQSSIPANKTTVPCYFFFNGFCNKGDRCSFLHGPDYSSFPIKPVKNESGSNDPLPLENKTSSGDKTGAISTTEKYLDPSEIVSKALQSCKFQPIEDFQRPVPKSAKQQDTSLQIAASEYQEAAEIKSDPITPEEGFVCSISHMCTEQDAEEQVNSHIEPEDRWESSPGFDVLVDDEMENLGYEDDSEYLPVLDREHRELNGQHLRYEFKDTDEYDPICPEGGILYEQEIYDGYPCMDGDCTFADDRNIPAYTRERIIDSILSRKRIRMPAEMTVHDRNLDLRDHLRRRREINGHVTGFLRRHESSCVMFRNPERYRRHGVDQRLSRRLTSEVGLSMIDSNGRGETLARAYNHGIFRHSQQQISRRQPQLYKERLAKQPFLSSKISRKPVPKQRRSSHESATSTFNGPKTLAEIKEEKKAAEEGHFKSTSADFQDPKPLSEILKDKRRSDCVANGDTCNN